MTMIRSQIMDSEHTYMIQFRTLIAIVCHRSDQCSFYMFSNNRSCNLCLFVYTLERTSGQHLILDISLLSLNNQACKEKRPNVIVECNKYFMRTKEPLPETVADREKQQAIERGTG